MRTEQQMFDLILGVAKTDERIRAVYMNGSRTNLNVKKDKYQDYDIVFVVTETESFIKDKAWIYKFGNPLIFQEPDKNDTYMSYGNVVHDFSRSYAWLMLFDDGNRIDLGIEIKEEAINHFLDDKLTVFYSTKITCCRPFLHRQMKTILFRSQMKTNITHAAIIFGGV